MMAELLLKAGSIALLLGGLIFVHELGHFLVAKLLGVKVVRFSIGFGPKLFGFHRGETEYRIAALPLGGYVKMAGDEPGEEPAPEDRGRGFLEQAPWKRFAIAFAGPAMNLIFPGAIYIAITLAQNGELAPGPRIGSVSPGSPAAAAGLQPGDRIVSVTTPDGTATPIRHFNDLRRIVSPHPGERLRIEVERGGTAPAALSGADEGAVEAFLAGRISFPRIAELCGEVLDAHVPEAVRSAQQALAASEWGRRAASRRAPAA